MLILIKHIKYTINWFHMGLRGKKKETLSEILTSGEVMRMPVP